MYQEIPAYKAAPLGASAYMAYCEGLQFSSCDYGDYGHKCCFSIL